MTTKQHLLEQLRTLKLELGVTLDHELSLGEHGSLHTRLKLDLALGLTGNAIAFAEQLEVARPVRLVAEVMDIGDPDHAVFEVTTTDGRAEIRNVHRHAPCERGPSTYLFVGSTSIPLRVEVA